MFCPHCGTQVPDQTAYCPSCGQPTEVPAGAAAPPPYAPPPAAQAFVVPDTININIGGAISEAWRIVSADIGIFVVCTLLMCVIDSVGILHGAMAAGMHILCINKLVRGRTEIGDFFKGFNYFVPTLIALLITGIFTFIGTLACIIPGIILGSVYMFVYLFIVDRKMDFWPAIEACHAIGKKAWGQLTLFMLALVCLQIVGALACLVGLLVTLPMLFAAVTVAYRDMVGFSSRGVD